MIELKNKDLFNILLTISTFNKDGVLVSGLLLENVSLGLKRRLQKIRSSVLIKYNELESDKAEIDKSESESKEKDIEELLQEIVKIDQDMVDIKMIEAIESNNFYDFELIEKIAK